MSEREKMPFIPEMHPKMIPVTWEHFVANMPPRSIALDGFVYDPPAFDPRGPHVNFDHHKGPPRSSMLCTSTQVLVAVREGLLDMFMPTGDEIVRVWMNDCDPDVGLSWYALEHHWNVSAPVNSALHRLYGYVQDMDRASGLLDKPRDLPIVKQAAWVFEPYWQFRFSGAIDAKDQTAYMGVLRDVTHRVNEFLAARGRELPIDDRYEVLGGGEDWIMVREIGLQARMRMARRGIRAFVSARQKPDGRWVYTICRKSAYVWWFPVPEICAQLNTNELEEDFFGGGDIVFGNARGSGSTRDPQLMTLAINAFLQDRNLRAP